MVPMASKKFASTSVNTSREAASTPTRENAPRRSTAPSRDRSGRPPTESGSVGTDRDQPFGFGSPFSTDAPDFVSASMTTAMMVLITMPMNSPPRTLRTTSPPQISRPRTKTRVGQVAIEPLIPRPTGTVVPAASGTRRTKPESTRPIMAMNRPIPTPIEAFKLAGIELKTASRKPVTARRTMMMPSMTTRPMASGQVSPSVATKVTATRVLMPRPAAMPNGYLAMTPKAMVITPAAKAVTAATREVPRTSPLTSAPVPRISGFRMMM